MFSYRCVGSGSFLLCYRSTVFSAHVNFGFVLSQVITLIQTKLFLLSIAVRFHVCWAAFFACRSPDRLGLPSILPLTVQRKLVSIIMTLWSIQLSYLLASMQSTSPKAVTASFPETETLSRFWIWYKQCRYLLSVKIFRVFEKRSKFAHVNHNRDLQTSSILTTRKLHTNSHLGRFRQWLSLYHIQQKPTKFVKTITSELKLPFCNDFGNETCSR